MSDELYCILAVWLRLMISVLLSSRPALGLEDPRGHFMEVLALALALDDKVLVLASALEPQVLALAS